MSNEKVEKIIASSRKISALASNSIVIQQLEEIFEILFLKEHE